MSVISVIKASLFMSTFVLAGPALAAVPVTVQPLSEQLIDLQVRSPARVVAANEAVVTAQVTAIVRSVEADVGATVEAGDLLIRLDDDDARLARDRARADLEALAAQIAQAESLLARGEELFAKNFISDDDLLERRTTVSVLRANRDAQKLAVASAELTLSRTRIVAPYNATVVARQAQVGSLAMPGTALITLVQTDRREVDADLDPRYAPTLGSAESLRFESRGRSWPVRLARLSSVIDGDSRIQKGRFRFVDEAAAIGTSGELLWQSAAGLIPVPLIVQRGDRFGVFVAEAGKARFVVLPDAQEGRPARSELPPETPIVIRGQSRLQDGDELQIPRQ
jgi:RND family efflux transporter MFP subunit